MTYRNVLIVCGGSGHRWNNYLGKPKQLAVIDGETLLARTVRQCRERNVIPVIVTAPGDTRMAVPGAVHDWAKPAPEMGATGRYWDSRHLWARFYRNVLLHGDVFFTDEAMDAILSFDDGWTCFARLGENELTGKPTGELFGVSFDQESTAEFERALLYTAMLWQSDVINRCIGFDVWRAMQGFRGPEVRGTSPYVNVGRCVELNDWTDDFDRPEDYERFRLRRDELDRERVSEHD